MTTEALGRQELLKRVLELVFAEFKPERGFVLLGSGIDGEPMKPAIVKYRTPPKDKEEAQFNVSNTIIKHAVLKAEGVLSTNAMTDTRFASGDSVQRLRIRSAICSPIRFGERTFGALYIDSSIANYTFTPEQLALLNAIGQHTGLALANADMYAQKLQTERLAAIGQTVASLSHAIKNILQGLRGGADGCAQPPDRRMPRERRAVQRGDRPQADACIREPEACAAIDLGEIDLPFNDPHSGTLRAVDHDAAHHSGHDAACRGRGDEDLTHREKHVGHAATHDAAIIGAKQRFVESA